MFYEQYHSPEFNVVIRRGPLEPLVGRVLSVSVDFYAEAPPDLSLPISPGGLLPRGEVEALDAMLSDLFEEKLLIDNEDPYADTLVKLKRQGLCDPVLFAGGVAGVQIAQYVGQSIARSIAFVEWNRKDAHDPERVNVAQVEVRLGRHRFVWVGLGAEDL
jgi:hypothetical protein